MTRRYIFHAMALHDSLALGAMATGCTRHSITMDMTDRHLATWRSFALPNKRNAMFIPKF